MRRLLAVVVALAAAGCSSTGTATRDLTSPSAGRPQTPTPSPTRTTATSADWPTYHGTGDRAGATGAGPRGHHLTKAWSTRLDAAVYAQPLIAAGSLVVATEADTVYALDPAGGAVRWRRHLAEPARLSSLPCGNIDPSGITGTPAYDAPTGQVFVAVENSVARHTLVALDVRDGTVRWRRDLDVLANRDRYAEQQRGALLVTGGRVYVPFGGRDGDCGNYVGYVAAAASDGSGSVQHYAVPTARQAGMWAPPGPVVGPGGDLYVASGNGAENGGRYDGSDSVIRLSPDLHRTAFFAPSTWPADNAQDLDLGSMSPVVVGDHLVIAGKRGIVYLLRVDLGGIGGQVASLDGCAGFGGAAARGGLVLLPCSDGIRGLRVAGDRMTWLWRNPALQGSPVIAGDTAWAFDGAALVAVDLATGRERSRVGVGDVTRFTTPVPAKDHLFVATRGGDVVAVTAR